MNQQRLSAILAEHRQYLDGNKGKRANLRGVNLIGVDIRGASFIDVNLKGASLQSACLIGVNFKGASLQNACLRGAYLQDANLQDADLTYASLEGATFSNNKIKGIKFSEDLLDEVPKIENIHKVVYENASKSDALNMDKWHKCETTHCRAGWVTYLAGAKGKSLEKRYGTSAAAALIYIVSDPNLECIPDFYAYNNKDALADMKRLAEQS